MLTDTLLVHVRALVQRPRVSRICQKTRLSIEPVAKSSFPAIRPSYLPFHHIQGGCMTLFSLAVPVFDTIPSSPEFPPSPKPPPGRYSDSCLLARSASRMMVCSPWGN
jgi:hypothetical protein